MRETGVTHTIYNSDNNRNSSHQECQGSKLQYTYGRSLSNHHRTNHTASHSTSTYQPGFDELNQHNPLIETTSAEARLDTNPDKVGSSVLPMYNELDISSLFDDTTTNDKQETNNTVTKKINRNGIKKEKIKIK